MISLTIKDTKQFMSHLLIKDTFDQLCVSEADIATSNIFSINGQINQSYYTSDDYAELQDHNFSRWASIKPFCFSLIKGNKVPSFMKIIFLLSNDECQLLLSKNALDFSLEDINGLYINIRYTDGGVTIITGTSIKLFTMDKSLEHIFDAYVRSFLDQRNIAYEEQ
jgi:hypothetical protein